MDCPYILGEGVLIEVKRDGHILERQSQVYNEVAMGGRFSSLSGRN